MAEEDSEKLCASVAGIIVIIIIIQFNLVSAKQ
jgi:hypothetical protein